MRFPFRSIRIALILNLILVCSLFDCQTSNAQEQSQDYTVTKSSGGSIKTKLGFGITLNKKSNLEREWVTLHNVKMPVDFSDTFGVTVKYEDRGYRYSAVCQIDVKEPLSAIEIRYLMFDIWGNTLKSLSDTEIEDYEPGKHSISASWNIFSENEASEFYASIAYISRVRTKEGKVLRADAAPVVIEAKKFSDKFTENDLEPKKDETKK